MTAPTEIKSNATLQQSEKKVDVAAPKLEKPSPKIEKKTDLKQVVVKKKVEKPEPKKRIDS